MTAYDPIIDSDGKFLGILYVGIKKAEFMEAANSTLLTIVYSTLAVVVLTLVASYIAARSLVRPLKRLTEAMHELANGNFKVALPGVGRGDEVGEVAQAVEAFKIKITEKASVDSKREQERWQVAEQIKCKALQDMAEAVERETNVAVGEVAVGTDRMAKNAISMSDSAALLGEKSSSVAAAAEQALANAQTVAAASTQLSNSIAEIALQVKSSRSLTVKAVAASVEAQSTIAKLSQTAEKVGEVTNLISEIASQTNLLALNATIEAARAGESGRGFAVVAAEVKSLAQQTAKATSEINHQITEIQQATNASVVSISDIGEAIRDVEQVSSIIAASIEEQNAVTVQISRTVEETSHAARDVATQIVIVSNEAIETGRRANEIRDSSAEVARKVDLLHATLVRVIRTSTTDVDRRNPSRVHANSVGSLKIDGAAPKKVTVLNLSLGGAMIDGLFPNPPVGTPVVLVVDGIPATLAGFVGRTSEVGTVISFDLSEDTQMTISRVVATHEKVA